MLINQFQNYSFNLLYFDYSEEDKDENEETENHESEYCAIGISLIIFVLFFPFAIFTFIKVNYRLIKILNISLIKY